ncbi:MAG: YfhO family protein [Vicinamibacteria bacterium]|nr:YfhO family protein [Vicinamibacteria bacterium]
MSYFHERPRWAAFSLLMILALYEFFLRAPVLLGSLALYQRDLFLLYFPLVQSALRGLSEGALPLRDPTSAFGQPLLADPSCQILYPPVALHLLFPPHQAYAWFVSIHSIFGAMGVAQLARRFSGGSWISGLVGGLAWLSSGPLLSLATLWHHMSGAAWIPWVLLSAVRVVDGDHRRGSLVLGSVFGMQILAGSADMCAMTALLALLFVPPPDYLRAWKAWATSVSMALALSAGVWLPAAELVSNSARSGLSAAVRTYWSLHPFEILEFFLPVPFTALPLLPEWRTAMFEGREPFLGSMFLGTALFPLCLAALADASIARRTRLACFLGATAGFLIALGKNAVAYSWVVAMIPPLKILRFPSKAMIPVSILICVLAGAGAASVWRSSGARRAAIFGTGVLATTAVALLGPLSGPFTRLLLDTSQSWAMEEFWRRLPVQLLVSVGLLGVLALYLRSPFSKIGRTSGVLALVGTLWVSFIFHRAFNATVPSTILSYKPSQLDLFRPGEGRLYVYDYSLFEGRSAKYLGQVANSDGGGLVGLEGLAPDSAALIASNAYLAPLTGAFWRVDYAWDGDLRLLFDRRLAGLTVGLRRVEGTPAFLKLLQISGVTRVAALHEKDMEGLRLLARKKIFYKPELRVFEVPSTLPRAYLVSGRTRSTGSDLQDLLRGNFDHFSSVLVDRDPVRPASPDFQGGARVVQRRADDIVVETSSNAPAFLTVLEGFMPGWRAYVDGRAAPLERANAIFVGTEVPAGNHRVEFRFLPTFAVIGVSLSAMTALFLFISLLLNRKAAETSG